MSRRVIIVGLDFYGEHYTAYVTVDGGAVEAINDVSILDERGQWKPVGHPTPNLREEIARETHRILDDEFAAAKRRANS